MGSMYALSRKLLIIGLLLEYFPTLLKIIHLRKIARNVPYFFTDVLFLMGRSRTFWGDQISSGEDKGGVRGGMREAQNEGYFCKIPIIKQDTNFISQIFGQTNF